MTHNEAIILSAYTGFLLVEDFSDVHKFCENLLGRPIFTSELADELVLEEIREKCKPLIIEMQKPKTNYDRIRKMSVEEMAAFITEINIKSNSKLKKGKDNLIAKYLIAVKNKKWLESEVEE